jgi:hypothetical protein
MAAIHFYRVDEEVRRSRMKPDSAPGPSVDFDGTWHNQHGSKMELKVSKAGAVTGLYATGVGAPGKEEWFDLVGWASEDQIAFTVNFGKYGSLTAWVGQQTQDASGDARIVTFWHLTKNVEDVEEPKKLWATVLTGSDVFTRTAPSAEMVARLLRRPSHPVVTK